MLFLDIFRGSLSGGPNVSQGFGGTGAYPEVTAFTDLPPFGDHNGDIYLVLTTTGTFLLGTKKKAGLYRSDGAAWNFIDATEFYRAGVLFVIDGGGQAVISTGVKGYFAVPFPGDIQNVRIYADQSGSIELDIKKTNHAGFPGSLSSIVASAPPAIVSALKSEDTTLTGWTTSIIEDELFEVSVTSVTSIKVCSMSLKLIKSQVS